MFLLLSLAAASAADTTPYWYGRAQLGGGLFSEGALLDVRGQVRTPLWRSESRMFQTTNAGAGLRVGVTPVHAEVGPRLSITPIEMFELEVQGSYLGYFSWGGRGLLPFDAPSGKLSEDRQAREDEQFSSSGLQLSATPTLKLKFGPVILFDSCTFSALHIEAPAEVDSPYVYDPSRDLVVAFDEVVIENQAGVLGEVLPGGQKPLLRVGATMRDRMAMGSGDRSLVVGGLVSFKATAAPAVPTVNVLALAYVIDADRVGTAPNLQLAASWTLEKPLR